MNQNQNKQDKINIFAPLTLAPVRRRMIGALFPLTPLQLRSVSSLIRHECCNWVDGRCILLDDDCCPQMISLHICCRWFQDCVLPAQPLLEAEIFHDTNLKKCVICGAKFIPGSPRGKYCPACSAAVRRKKNAAYKRKSRGK